ncbi:MAG: hypothetical protein J6D30_05880 [Clostridia bacterium]|nr:hypothetical protein [Clostridia bacterium]
MYLKLRIIFTWIAVAFAVAVFPVGTFLGFTWAIICVAACALFAGLMYICKQKQEEIENADKANNSTKPDEKIE